MLKEGQIMTRQAPHVERGYVHVYTGNGKGKTTAALGLALRAAGAGLKVYFAQFIKAGRSSEIAALERHADRITVRQLGRGGFLRGAPDDADAAAALEGLCQIRDAIRSGGYQMVVLDEASVAIQCGLFSVEDLLEWVDSLPEGVELVITGRYAPARLVERADLVTEMVEIKHYYRRGVLARDGIER